MKIVIYTLYAVTVLLFSGFARASDFDNSNPKFHSPVQIIDIGVDYNTMDLHIAGYVPNPCYQIPSGVLIQDPHNPSTLILRLVSPSRPGACIERLKDYSTVVSLRQLAQASQLPLEDKAAYIVKTENFDFAMQVFGQDLK